MSLAKFRHRYPQGSLVSELVEIDRGLYIVKALVQIDNLVLATGLAGATTVEAAEDAAKQRAIASLLLDQPTQATSFSPDVLPQSTSTSASVVPPSSPSALLTPEVTVAATAESGNYSNDNIVNFSKPQPEPKIEKKIQNEDLYHTFAPETSAVATPTPQLKLDLPQADSSPLTENPTESNLFGDTFMAQTPVEISHTSPATPISDELEAMKFNEIKQKTDIEIKRLSWTKEQGKEFLMSRYGRKSRLHLTDEQLLEFLRYLEKLPSPVK